MSGLIEFLIIWFGLVGPWLLIGFYSICSLKEKLVKENKE